MKPIARSTVGIVYGISAYGLWGIMPLFWRYLRHVSPFELLMHRIVWTFACFAAWMVIRGQLPALRRHLVCRRTLARLALSSLLLAGNWLIFLYAVLTERVLEVSLGYFINPLFMVALGAIFLGERLRRLQAVAVGLATVGIIVVGWLAGGVSWIALTLASGFAVYGLLRKTVVIEPVVGSTIEGAFSVPIGLASLAWLYTQGDGHALTDGPATIALLAAGGFLTALTLLWFVNAAQRLPLSTMGFLQYLAPSIQFMIAVFVLGEPMDTNKLLAFSLVWLGLGLFTYDAWVTRSRS